MSYRDKKKQKEWYRKHRLKCKINGICISCCKNKSTINKTKCNSCRKQESKNGKIRRIRMKKEGLCLNCCKLEVVKRNLCSLCLLKTKAREAGFNINQALTKFNEQNRRCAYSDILLTEETASPDHIIPICKGGNNNIDNLAWVSWEINQMKRHLGKEIFISLCKRVSENGPTNS